jgi:glutamate-ammonia-ligase adenylyltransferase
VTAALSVATAAGPLYEVDTRLRPQGNQGPLAVSIDSFARYQREDAWTWEHMALTRARVLAGPAEAREQLDAILAEVLGQRRDPTELKADVLKMRAEMAAHKHPAGELDAKLLRGGLVDLEFIVHFLQLRERMAFTPYLRSAVAQLTLAGHLPQGLAEAHAFLTRVLVSARLLAPDCTTPPPAACRALARACQMEDFADLLESLGEARKAIADAWGDVFGEKLEIE